MNETIEKDRIVKDFLTKGKGELVLGEVSRFMDGGNGQRLASWINQNKHDPEKLKQKQKEVDLIVLGSLCMVNGIGENLLRQLIFEYRDALGEL